MFCSVYKIFVVTILTENVSVTNIDTFEKKQFSLQFFFSLLQVYIVYRVSDFSPKCPPF